jgi:hypothetical protein
VALRDEKNKTKNNRWSMTPSRKGRRRRKKFTRLIKKNNSAGLFTPWGSLACNKMTMMNVQPTTKLSSHFFSSEKKNFF